MNMNTDSKYYHPDISEFHIGFEYDVSDVSIRTTMIDFDNHSSDVLSEPVSIDWSTKIVGFATNYNDLTHRHNLLHIKDALDQKRIRVRYLSRYDIETFGFMCVGDTGYELKFHGYDKESDCADFYTITMNLFDTVPNITIEFEKHMGNDIYSAFTLFNGIIKNKSELKKLLCQLQIPKNIIHQN